MIDYNAIKANAKKMWSTFAAFETVTGLAAPELVKFAGIQKGRASISGIRTQEP